MRSILAWVLTQKGNEFQVRLPAKRVVCTRCDGTGVHDHPCFSSGVDVEQLEDPDFSENYLRGNYDVRCEACNGERVLDVLDYDACSAKMKSRIDRADRELRRHQAEIDFERRVGA